MPQSKLKKRDYFNDMLVIPPISEDISTQQKIEKLQADYLAKNAIVIRKKLLIAALNKGMEIRLQQGQQMASSTSWSPVEESST